MRRLWMALPVVFACLGSTPETAADDPPVLKVCMVSGSAEYESDRTLAEFAKYLEAHYPVRCTLLKAQGVEDLPGLEALYSCDVALFFTRRLKLQGEQLERIKAYCAKGKPIVGVRTASHGIQTWLEFDHEVLGGNYKNHLTNKKLLVTTVTPGAERNPILEGVGTIRSRASLYRTMPLADDCTPLLIGKTDEGEHPVAWTRMHKGGRVFYVSLGDQGDFENAAFRLLLSNGLFWAAGRTMAKAEAPVIERPRKEGVLRVAVRSQAETNPGSGVWKTVAETREVPVATTAILICDMWDEHWCRAASERCGKLAVAMNPVVKAAREAGIRIIHCPSETMPFYADTPQRLRAMAAPKVKQPPLREISDPPLPIDDSDGGCDSAESKPYQAWSRQHPAIEIGPDDAITDQGDEVYNLLKQWGVSNVLVMGVHTNMCVLNRTFAIRRMTKLGFRCVLVRDLTDAMYDPRDRPFVSHSEGTDLVIRHIEAYWAPTVTSEQILKGLPGGDSSR